MGLVEKLKSSYLCLKIIFFFRVLSDGIIDQVMNFLLIILP